MFNRNKTSFHRIQVYIFLLSAALSSTFLFSGCSKQDDYPKTRDIDYTVVTVNELYLSDNYIVFDTELYGPKQKSTSKAKSYPYIVVKTEYINKSIVFK